MEGLGEAEHIRRATGMNLSPYFPASKIAWILEHVEGAGEKAAAGEICHGTIDSWLIYKLTGGKSYKTDYSNASRTQLFNIFELTWDADICRLFGIDPANLAEVCDSDSDFGETDFEGLLPRPVPIHGVLGDSHGSLFGQGCLRPGMIKSTYGTGSSIMMNIGERPVLSTHGVVTSLAWSMGGKVSYVLEGNLNYTGAVITWLKDDLKLISSPGETEGLAREAVQDDSLYLVPAFSGLGAPYWDSRAAAAIVGMTRTTGRAEVVRAGVECIAYQITDIVKAMSQDAGVKVEELRVDGGPTRNRYLMQFQSDIAQAAVQVPDSEELSGIGPAYAAGLALGVWDESIFDRLKRVKYEPKMKEDVRTKKYSGWKSAVSSVLTK
nr:FGGY-family carbohydrate kinase [Dorea sp. D27]